MLDAGARREARRTRPRTTIFSFFLRLLDASEEERSFVTTLSYCALHEDGAVYVHDRCESECR